MSTALKSANDSRAASEERQRYLFVSGCPRSGTTIVTTILNWSDEAFVCQERFAPLIGRMPHLFAPELYQMPRILQFEKRDCGYPSFEAAKGYSIWYANPKRFDDPGSYSVIGDKITHLFRRFGLLACGDWENEDVTLIHVIRNPVDVANSYAVRNADAADPCNWDCQRAIADWIESVANAHAFQASKQLAGRFALVDYDAMFGGGLEALERHARALYDHCGLAFGSRQKAGIALINEAFSSFKERRAVSDDVAAAVRSGVPEGVMCMYHELRRKCLGTSALPAGSNNGQEANL